MSADTDVSRAWLTRWNADNDLADVIPGGIAADRLTKMTGSPYVRLVTGQHKPPDYSTNTEYIDYRKVTLTLYGVGRESLGAVVKAIKAKFDPADGDPKTLDFSFSTNTVAHMRTQPLSEEITIDQQQKAGEDIRDDVLVWVVWTHRRG